MKPSFPLSLRALVPVVSLLALSACTLGPDYRRPEVPLSGSFRAAEGWKPATPADALARGAWWALYDDAELNALVERLDRGSPDLAAAEARYRQALALVRDTRSQLFPVVGAGASYSRAAQGDNAVARNHELGVSASWEADLWGRLRRGLEADRALAEASAADLAAVRLSLQAAVVTNYLQLRVLDAQQRLLDQTVEAYRRSLQLTRNQFEAGIVPRSDVAQAQTQLKSTEAQAIDLRWQRAQLEHALAVLTGVPPADFSLAVREVIPPLPVVPPGVPSTLLERRPDIAAAERQVMAANAEMGIAKAAWFPSLTLSAGAGYAGSRLGSLLETPNRFWSLGPDLAVTLLDFGARRARQQQAEAAYDEVVANYRQTVLTGLREVEDYLIQLRVLADEAAVQQEALIAAQEALSLMENQYRAGVVDYLSVATLQTTALNNQRTSLTLLGSRLTASVQLIAALGGGWDGTVQPVSAAASR